MQITLLIAAPVADVVAASSSLSDDTCVPQLPLVGPPDRQAMPSPVRRRRRDFSGKEWEVDVLEYGAAQLWDGNDNRDGVVAAEERDARRTLRALPHILLPIHVGELHPLAELLVDASVLVSCETDDCRERLFCLPSEVVARLASLDDAELEAIAVEWASAGDWLDADTARWALPRIRTVCARAASDGSALVAAADRDD